MRYFPFCPICGQVAVLRAGDPCLRCVGELEAIVNPDNRDHTTTARSPLGIRILNRITGRNHL